MEGAFANRERLSRGECRVDRRFDSFRNHGALVGLGIPEHEAKFYHGEIQRGRILVGVHADQDRAARAKSIMNAAGAEKVTTG